MKIVFSPECLEYRSEGHPKALERVSKAHELLKNKFDFVRPERASREDVLRVHTENLLNKIKRNEITNIDTPNISGIYEYASLSAGAAIKACELALKGKGAFSLMRPPGHHAGKNFLGGFCYFNNIAIAVSRYLDSLERVCIIDFDCHHGNGTQDIFLGNKKILYISLHQNPLFPGTGIVPEQNCLNYPLGPGTGERAYLAVFDKALEDARKFRSELVAVSAGFDSYKEYPLTGLGLETETFSKIAKGVASLETDTFSVLEGGYSEKLPQCIEAYLNGFSD